MRVPSLLVGDGLVPSRRALPSALAVRLRELLCLDQLLGAFNTGGDKPRPYGVLASPAWRFALAVLLAMNAPAEQFREFGDWRVHYIAVGASFLPREVAERHGIVRGDNKAIVNISAIGADGRSGAIGIAGSVTNLLGQKATLRFREVRDGAAIYYIAPLDFEDAETLRFELRLTLPDHGEETLSFQQSLYGPLP